MSKAGSSTPAVTPRPCSACATACSTEPSLGQCCERCGRAVELVERVRPRLEGAAPVVEQLRGPRIRHAGAVAERLGAVVDLPGRERLDPLHHPEPVRLVRSAPPAAGEAAQRALGRRSLRVTERVGDLLECGLALDSLELFLIRRTQSCGEPDGADRRQALLLPRGV